MSLRRLAPLWWIVALLAALELALEVRAARQGWPTLLLPSAVGAPSANADVGPNSGAGPTSDFPFRSPRPELVAPPSATRLWFASASYAEDVQQRVDDVFPNLTAALLRERGVECVALNASSAGHTVAGNSRDLERSGARWKPQVIVLYQMSNDIDKLSTALCSRGWQPPQRAADVASDVASDPALLAATQVSEPKLADKLVESTTIYKHIKSSITARVVKGRALARTLGEAGDALFELRVREFLARCRELGATPVLCTFPTAYTLETRERTPSEYEFNLLRFNVFLALEGWLTSVERFNAVLRRLAASERVALIDVAERFAGRAELFRDMWHLTKEGHALVAAQLADELERVPTLVGTERK